MGLSAYEPFRSTSYVSICLEISWLVLSILRNYHASLEPIDLWDNRIQQSVIFFGQLPPNLIYVKFYFVAGNNLIGELRSTSTENVERLGEIFPDMPRKHIHIE